MDTVADSLHDETEVTGVDSSNMARIACASLEAWEKRDQQEPFLPDNRTGYARVSPVGLTATGMASQTSLPEDQCPLHGLGFYDEALRNSRPMFGQNGQARWFNQCNWIRVL